MTSPTTEAAGTPAPDAGPALAAVPAPREDGTASSNNEPPKKSGPLAEYAEYLPDRRQALWLLGGALFGVTAGAGGYAYAHRAPEPEVRDDDEEFSSKEARERLEAGNARFVAGTPLYPDQTVDRRKALSGGQKPLAVILSCADSRVPPELLFDQGLGDLFVVRSAGQVVDHAVLGSLQYGVEHLGAPLVVVLGHSSCGAVKATLEAVETHAEPSGTDIDALVEAITPAVHEAEEIGAEEDEMLGVAIDMNVERIVEQLKEAALIEEAAALRHTKVVGATYSLKTGEVTWL